MKKSFRLVGLDCANCAAKMENAISKIPEVQKVTVSFMTTRMTIEANEEDMPDILEKAAQIIKKYKPDVVIKRA